MTTEFIKIACQMMKGFCVNFAGHQVQTHIPSSHSSLTSTQLPENIHNLLVKEADWDFDIIQLERVTNKR